MTEKLVPSLRFAGYTDAWEKRQLGEVLEERNEQICENKDYPLMSFVQNVGVVPKGERYDRSFLVKDINKKYKKTEFGDFIYSSNNLETGSIGFNRTGKAVISPVYSIFSSKNNRESEFIGILSTQKFFINKMIQFRQGVVYGQWRIHETDFLSIIINIPSVFEQEKIITFFSQLDRAIALQERKCQTMAELKKTLLKKMFPENDANVPALRFEGYTDTWEKRQLGEVLKERKIQQPQSTEYPLVSFTVEKGVTPKTERYDREQLVVGEKESKKYKVTKIDDIVYNPANLKFGAISRNKYGNAVFSPIYVTFEVDQNEVLPSFIENVVTQVDFITYALQFQQGTVYERQSVSPEDFLGLLFKKPTLSEQTAIGNFFSQLDRAIALQERTFLKKIKGGHRLCHIQIKTSSFFISITWTGLMSINEEQ